MTSGAARRTIRAARAWRPALALVVPFALAMAGPVAALPIEPGWAPPATVFIPETGHTIDRLFLDRWRGGGGVWAFGNPITREIERSGRRVVQYYEYARFEYLPRGGAGGDPVAMGAIGAELRLPVVPRRGGVRESRVAAMAAREARAWLPLDGAADVAAATSEPSYRFVPETGHGVWGGFRAFWEGTGEAAYLGNPVTEEYRRDGVSFQVFERGKLRWRPGEEVGMVPVGRVLAERYRLPTKPGKRDAEVPVYDEALFVPPVATPGAAPVPPVGVGRAVVVSLGEQALWAYDGGKVVRSTFVSTGTERFITPTGLYYVNAKIDVQTMEGVLGGEYYNVPDVPYVMYFTDRGHALHGTYWHENFGEPMSHGCVNLPMDAAEWLYGWAPPGTPVLIVE